MFAFFELLLCTSEPENLSPVVASVAQSVTSVAQSVPVVGPGTITVVAVVGISISLWLSISGPLSIVVGTMGVGVSISVCSVAQTMVAQSVGTIVVSISISLWLSLSGPLAVDVAMMGIGVSGISIGSIGSVGVRVGTIAVSQPWVSLSLRLGLWLTGDEGGKANHKSELHCCLSD